MAKKAKIEDKSCGNKRALVYKNKYFYYTNREEYILATKKMHAWQVLIGDIK